MANDLVQLVNTLQGTETDRTFSRGNTLPIVARPFGMTHWSAQTEEAWFFQRQAACLQGIRATHQPSPWIHDYGHFTLMPTTGPLYADPGAYSSFYRKELAVFKPHYFRAVLARYQVDLEATATERCGVIRATFPSTDHARFLIRTYQDDCEISIDLAAGAVTGCLRQLVKPSTNVQLYYFIQADKPIVGQGAYDDEGMHEGGVSLKGKKAGGYIEFDASAGATVTLRIGTSFISADQARRNLETEVAGRSFDEVKAESEAVWQHELERIEIEGATDAQRATFYTCLYRAFLFPRMFHEFDGDGRMVHYSPYDGQIHEGELYTDNGFWDTYRTVYSFLALVAPKRLGEIMRGWTNGAKEGGWFPRWASPGYRGSMIGTHMDNVVPDAYLRGIRDFDIQAAYKAIRRDAFEPGPLGTGCGRDGLQAYLDLGHCAADEVSAAASRTQDYAYNDFGVAQVAEALGHRGDAEILYKRALNYRNVYDPSIGFMRGRNRDGSWLEPFSEFSWGYAYVEGGAWQSTWDVQHDPAGLIELMGGQEAFVDKLDRMLSMPPIYETGRYVREIHEMAEMAAVDFGQYAHSNQPVHHVLFLYAAAGRPDRTQYWVRRVMDELYSADTLAGDEDNGEMCCWYLLNALGIFPLCPGHPSFVLGSPLFRKAIVHLDNGATLTVEAADNNPQDVYVQGVSWNGATHRKNWIPHSDLAAGGTLRFTMGSRPVIPDLDPDGLPFSLSTSR